MKTGWATSVASKTVQSQFAGVTEWMDQKGHIMFAVVALVILWDEQEMAFEYLSISSTQQYNALALEIIL